jgi:hypothetical protein
MTIELTNVVHRRPEYLIEVDAIAVINSTAP